MKRIKFFTIISRARILIPIVFVSLCVISLLSSNFDQPFEIITPNPIIESNYDFLNNSQDWIFGNFTILNENRCQSSSANEIDKFEALMLIHSDPDNYQSRSVIREHLPEKIKAVFLFGTRSASNQVDIIKESAEYGDIVQGSFIDSYRNLTRKHIMGLSWAALYCPSAPFVWKADDDIFINYTMVFEYLEKNFPPSTIDPFISRTPSKLLIGYVFHDSEVIRNFTSKWYVNSAEFPEKKYPNHVSGWLFITTIEVIKDLLNQVPSTPFLWIDDVYVTGLLRVKVKDVFFHRINKWFNSRLEILSNWISEPDAYHWPYMVSNADPLILNDCLDRCQTCEKFGCKCCLPYLTGQDEYDRLKSSTILVPKNVQANVREIHFG